MSCRSCGSPVRSFMNFGKMPLGNAFVRPEGLGGERLFELGLGLCSQCKLVQQTNPPPTRAIENDYLNYAYTPFGSTLDGHYRELASRLMEIGSLTPDSFVLDIGSNNGLLLGYIRDQARCSILGIEPARKISQMAIDAGIPTINDFYSADVNEKVATERGQADLVTITQVLQHIPELEVFMGRIVSILKPDGVLAIEGRYFADTVRKTTYDTVYHEMISFFTLTSLANLCERNGLTIFKAEKSDIYGGSLRVYASKTRKSPDASMGKILAEEEQLGLSRYDTYRAFASKAKRHALELRELVISLAMQGKKIAGYGAPSTSATLLRLSRIGHQEIEYLVDDNPLKQGLLAPGTHIPIVPFDTMVKQPPDYLLILAWRLEEEILQRIGKQRVAGMKFILPLPEVRVVS